ncbi:TetR/AcrR family transcriptional regulator [Kribbella koreensis]|uniref:TetR/AcrR family transcriptional regulator n=1 Tax=Kribbella koreensis TaxID=57909 RepID=A0ABN1QG92_9ACTN
MARSRNPAHRLALLAAATKVIAAEGLGASTASIAREAGVSTGTLFVYFETKAALINELYVVLKSEMGRAATENLQAGAPPREQLRSMWDHWIAWAVNDPVKRHALAHLSVAEELGDDSRLAVHAAYAGIAEILERIVADGPMREVPLSFVSTLMSAIADATIDDLIANPDPSGTRSTLAFDAMWRALGG